MLILTNEHCAYENRHWYLTYSDQFTFAEILLINLKLYFKTGKYLKKYMADGKKYV